MEENKKKEMKLKIKLIHLVIYLNGHFDMPIQMSDTRKMAGNTPSTQSK